MPGVRSLIGIRLSSLIVPKAANLRRTGSAAPGLALLLLALIVGLLIAGPGNKTRSGSRHLSPASSADDRSSSSFSTLPAPARASVSRSLGADQPRFWAHRAASGELVARNRAQVLSTTFSSAGPSLTMPGGDVT